MVGEGRLAGTCFEVDDDEDAAARLVVVAGEGALLKWEDVVAERDRRDAGSAPRTVVTAVGTPCAR